MLHATQLLGVMLHTLLTERLFTPGRVTVLFEDGEVRLSGSYMGDSIGAAPGETTPK